jgi:acetyl esterase/lipase
VKLNRVIVRAAICGLVSLALMLLVSIAGAYWYLHPSVQRTDGVIYGERLGRDLELDLIRPRRPNGCGIVFMVSGGWRSAAPGETPTWLAAPLLRRGYTVFAVCHVSQPQATVMEIIEDAHRAVRFIRSRAREFGIDAKRLGVTGGSAGGHLALMLATGGGQPALEARDLDAIDRQSSSVQAVAVFYPVTDLLNLGESSENPGNGGPPKSFVKAFGPNAADLTKWRAIGRHCSPIYFVSPALPPILIIHGDADTLVPLEQSLRFQQEAAKHGGSVEVRIKHGGRHGWLTMILDLRRFGKWFDRHLLQR